jgi:hypothetical protein
MATRCLVVAVLALIPLTSYGGSIDGRVLQVEMPFEDVTVMYIETKGGMAVQLQAPSASVQGTKFYVGDGKVAVELAVIARRGIVFQGKTVLKQGDKFRKESEVKVLPGYKKASELAPGDIYVTLPGVTFKVPEK